ncbi:MAG: DUF368 domain-containing protein [Clostridiales bacterium]|nr:DUF368 domain-containing protein [Clostridiales bacterium]
MDSFFKKLIAGFMIGVGAIIPGFSGGILAVSMGLYKPTIDAVTGFFKAPKKNFRFLLPLAIGGGIGFLLFMFLLDWLFGDFRTAVICVFVGLVIGSMPSLLRECNEKGFKKHYPLWAVLGFAASFALIILGLVTNAGAQREVTPVLCMISGAIIMSGVLLPGVSISFILLNLGVYENFLAVFTAPPKLFIAAHRAGSAFGECVKAAMTTVPSMLFGLLGMVIIAVPVLLLVKKVIEKHHGPAYYVIFGVVIATTLGCIIQEVVTLANDPAYVFAWWKVVIYAALLAGGMALSLSCEKFMRYREEAEEAAEAELEAEEAERDACGSGPVNDE